MTVEIAVVISVLSLVLSAFKTFSDSRRNVVKDTENAAEIHTSSLVELRMANKGIDDIKKEIKDFRTEIKEIRDKVIEVEVSTKQAHKRIDELVLRMGKYTTSYHEHETKEE